MTARRVITFWGDIPCVTLSPNRAWVAPAPVRFEHWFRGSREHNPARPALLEWNANLELVVEKWCVDGAMHREDGPALIVNRVPGCVTTMWYQNGQRHRDGAPAVVLQDHNWSTEIWYQRGEKHRADGPAHIACVDNVPVLQKWYVEGVRHREDGPAIVAATERWFLDGEELTAAEIEAHLRSQAAKDALGDLPQPIFEEIWDHYRRY